jgi:hypothetical protein
MERDQFVRNNPEKVLEQDREGWKWTYRIIGIVTLGVSAYIGLKYHTDNHFSSWVNELIESTWEWYIVLITDLENLGTPRNK